MPSTARVTISQRNTSQTVTESLDDVWDTQYGRHLTYSLVAAQELTVPWPSTGEQFVYISVTSVDNAVGTIALKPDTTSGSAWIANLLAVDRVPFMLPRPTNASFILLASANAEASMLFF